MPGVRVLSISSIILRAPPNLARGGEMEVAIRVRRGRRGIQAQDLQDGVSCDGRA